MKRKKRINFDDEDLSGYSTNQLKRIADYSFRKHLLSQWDGRCFISGRFLHENQVHASHYIDRNRLCNRWNVKNVHLISASSNLFDAKVFNKEKWGDYSKHHFEYRQRLVEVYGEVEVQKLELPCKREVYTKDKLIKIINDFRIF